MNYLFPLITAIIGAVAGYFLSLNKEIKIMKRQEVTKAKDNIIIGINDFIIKVEYNNFGNGKTRLYNIIDNLPIIKGLLKSNIIHLKSSASVNIMEAYENYENPNIPNGITLDHPFKIYGMNKETFKKYTNFKHKSGTEYAIYNLNKILEIIN